MYKIISITSLVLILALQSVNAQSIDKVTFITPQVNATSGSQICLPLEVANFDEVIAVQFGIKFNPSVLAFSHAESVDLPDMKFGTTQAANGELRALWVDPESLSSGVQDGSTIAELCFNVIGEIQESTIINITGLENLPVELVKGDLSMVPYETRMGTINIDFSGSDPIDVPLIDNPFAIEITDQQLRANQAYTIPINIAHPDGLVGISAQFTIDHATVSDLRHDYGQDKLQTYSPDAQRLNLLYMDLDNSAPLAFELEVIPTRNIPLSEVLSIGTGVVAEIVTSNIESNGIEIDWIAAESDVIAVELYPNPTSDILNVNMPASYIGGTLELYNIIGKRLMQQEITGVSQTLDIKSLNSVGNLILRIENDDQRESYRISVTQ